MLDVLIKGGNIVDGSGKPAFHADVAIEDGRIVAVEPLPEAVARYEVDARGMVVAPGFIDMHSHADFTLPILPTADSKVRQGITLEVIGNCGVSPAPLREGTRQHVEQSNLLSDVALPWEWDDFGTYLSWLENYRIAVNVVALVGHGAVRIAVMGMSDATPTPEQLTVMQEETRLAMEQGAMGLSSGLVYPPGCYSQTEELVSLARIVAEHQGMYFSHIRGEGPTLIEAISEAIAIGQQTGVPVQIGHLKASGRHNWPKMAQALQLIDNARAMGLDVAADMYPYIAGSTTLSALLPTWAQADGVLALLSRLRDSEERARIFRAIEWEMLNNDYQWDHIFISGCTARPQYEGRHIAELAAEAGKAPEDTVMDILLEAEAQVFMALFIMDEENVRLGLRHPAIVIGTDGDGRATYGPLSRGKPHPRNYGTFPRLLGHYVRDEGLMPLEAMVGKFTGQAAARLGLTDRGFVRPGMWGDVVIFSPQTIRDRATFADPHQYPEGILWVFINGQAVVADGVHTGARPGRVLRR
jgi:N-acyl-D-amino-acid deacylase